MPNLASHLIAHWDLTTDGADSVASLDLTEEGTVTYGANGAELSTSNYLRIPVASAGALQLGTDSQSWSFEFQFDSVPASSNVPVVMFGYDGDPGLQDGMGVLLNSSSQLLFRFSDGTTQAAFTASGTYTTGTWYHVVISANRAGNMVGFVNGSQVGSVSISTYSATSLSSPLDFVVGGELATRYFDGRVRHVGVWDFPMGSSPDLIDWIYNAGSGRSYSDIAAFNAPFVRRVFTATQESNTTGVTFSVDGLLADDLVLVFATSDGNTASAPLRVSTTGFSDVITPVVVSSGSNPATFGAFGKTLTSDNEHTSLTVLWDAGERGSVVCLLVENAGTVEDAESATNVGDSTPDGPTTTVTTPGLVLYGVGHDQNSALSAAPSGVLVVGNIGVSATAGTRTIVGRNRPTSAGTFGPGTWTLGGSFNSVTFGLHVQSVGSGAAEVSGGITQGTATAGGVVDVLVQASGSLTQGGATVAGAADVIAAASGSLTQGAATLSGSAGVLVQVNGTLTQGGAVVAGVIGTPTLEVSGSLTQGSATVAGATDVLVQTSGSLVQGLASLAGGVGVLVQVSGSLTQGGAVLAGNVVDPNNQIADIELSAAPLFNVAFSASPLFNIALTAEPRVT